MFSFDFNQSLTKEFLLSKYPQEVYLQYYLGIPVKKGLFRNPLRQDSKPTASFYRNGKGEIIFKDFSGAFRGNFVDVVMFKYSCDYHKALKIIANDFNIIPDPNLVVNKGIINSKVSTFKDDGKAIIQVEIKDYTNAELLWWEQYGITLKTLKKFRIFSCKSVFLNTSLLATIIPPNMAFGYYGGKKDGLEQWRVYFPFRTNYRFLTNWPANKIQGIEFIPKEGNLLCITKSYKDVLCLYELGIPAIAPNSENLFIPKEILIKLKRRFKWIIVLYDNDRPGLCNMAKIRHNHPDLEYIYIPKEYDAKDISDFRKTYGEKKTRNLIVNYLKYLKNRYETT